MLIYSQTVRRLFFYLHFLAVEYRISSSWSDPLDLSVSVVI